MNDPEEYEAQPEPTPLVEEVVEQLPSDENPNGEGEEEEEDNWHILH